MRRARTTASKTLTTGYDPKRLSGTFRFRVRRWIFFHHQHPQKRKWHAPPGMAHAWHANPCLPAGWRCRRSTVSSVAGALAGTMLSGFHARVLGVSFDAFRVIVTGTGLLAIAGGRYTRVHLRGVVGVEQEAKQASASAATPGGGPALPLGTEVEE